MLGALSSPMPASVSSLHDVRGGLGQWQSISSCIIAAYSYGSGAGERMILF